MANANLPILEKCFLGGQANKKIIDQSIRNQTFDDGNDSNDDDDDDNDDVDDDDG